MLLPFLISQIIVATLAISFHKYPYVFLLDVGNEEIPKVNAEQIRLSIPGGSLAIKYPATGDGDIIGHVRVSGIDFGTDLKASIVQGGPGYRYVVLVFIGKPGTAYDAVVTIQTVPTVDDSPSLNTDNTNQELENDPNNSAEDTNDSTEIKNMYSENSDTIITQSSSNVYKYSSNDSPDINEHEINNIEDINKPQDFNEVTDEEVENEVENQVSDHFSDDDVSLSAYLKGDISDDTINENNPLDNTNSPKYGKYEAFRPLFIGGVRFYPQAGIYLQDLYNKPVYDQENDQNEAQAASDFRSNIKYKDGNNNFDPDYASPVEY